MTTLRYGDVVTTIESISLEDKLKKHRLESEATEPDSNLAPHPNLQTTEPKKPK